MYCCFFAKHTALKSRSKDWLIWNQDNNVSGVQSSHRHHYIECNLFLAWYSRKIARLWLSNHSLYTKVYFDTFRDIKETDLLLIDGLVSEMGPAVKNLWCKEGGKGLYPPPSLHVCILLVYLKLNLTGMILGGAPW